jgi:hypothetical protein
MYETEQEAKKDARAEEHKALLKEIKQTKEHERKCIAKMWDAETKAMVAAVQAEAEERKALMREEMKLKIDLLREGSSARLEAMGDTIEAARAESEVSRESSQGCCEEEESFVKRYEAFMYFHFLSLGAVSKGLK